MASQREVRTRIASFKNIEKITRAMEAVSAARLRRAEQRIVALRPYADAIRRMTRQASRDAGGEISRIPLLATREPQQRVAILLITADRGLAGAFNSQIVRAGTQLASELEAEQRQTVWYASGRRGVSSLTFRGRDLAGSYTGFTDRPAYADARQIAGELITAFLDGAVDRAEIIYNAYISPLTQRATRETLLPASAAALAGSDDEDERGDMSSGRRAHAEYEPEADELLRELVPHYVEVSIYRALLESAASEHGARMTAMRNATDNAGELIDDLTLEMNRARQAEITQEILEVVAGAGSLV
ncbi:MAG TPA: ATP synthase F1 subunit gamma [Solirubrobacteraceae bacterium]|nr:ATP synthase F1 subunit gamma [Solirubrobacteraceae bacterium]